MADHANIIIDVQGFILYFPNLISVFYQLLLIIMTTGTVKFFNESKGYGFIKEDGTDSEVFVHVSELQEPISENDKVEYEVTEGKKGLNATNVKKI